MSRPFAAFDIDGTLIRWQLYHAIADSLVKLGYVDAGQYETIQDARMDWKRRFASFKTYEHELVRVYNQVLKTLSVEQFEKAADIVFEEYKDQVYTYTRDLISDLKKRGYLIFAISGSQSEIIEKMADYYGFDDFAATTYERVGRGFSGSSTAFVNQKDVALKQLAERNGATFKGSIAVGDSLSDEQMLRLVDTPIAFNPEKELFEQASKKGWQIVLERKNMVYKLDKKDGKYLLASAK